MGAITRGIAFNIASGGVFEKGAVKNSTIAAAQSISAAGGGSHTIITKTSISAGTSTITFTSGIDSTYKGYLITLKGIHPSADGCDLQFSAATDGATWNVSKTAGTNEMLSSKSGSHGQAGYQPDGQALSDTGNHKIFRDLGNKVEENLGAWCYIWDPANTTTYKAYMMRTWGAVNDIAGTTDGTIAQFVGGVLETTSAVNGFRFNFNTGTFDDGVATMYGIQH